MAVRSGFFDSVNGDRKYDALDMSSIFDGIIEDGIFSTIENAFKVAPGEGLQVTVDTGKAWFNHTWTVNDALYPLSIEAPDITLDRYDAVVLEINAGSSIRANSLKIVKGTAASEPQKPQLTSTEEIHQYPLAYVKVNHGASSIQAKDIEITVGRGECPFVRGPLEVMSIDEIYAKWEQEFSDWFDNIQAQLEGDIATNLQRQIDTINQKENSEGVYYKKSTPYAKFYTHDGEELKTPEGWQVGDVINTMRSEVGDGWALCNGQYIPNSGDYDKYAALNPDTLKCANFTKSSNTAIRTEKFQGEYYEASLQVANGVYFIFVSRTKLFYSTNCTSWVEVDLSTHSSKLYGARKIAYIQGKYYIYSSQMGKLGASEITTLTLLESSNLTDWATKTLNVDQTGVSSVYLNQTVYLNHLLELSGKVLFVFCPSDSYSYYAKIGIADNMDSTVNIERPRIASYGIKNGYRVTPSQSNPNLAKVIDNKFYFITCADNGINHIDVYQLNGYDVSEVASYSLDAGESSTDLYDFLKVGSTYYLIHAKGILASTDLSNWTNLISQLGNRSGPIFFSSFGMVLRYPTSSNSISATSSAASSVINAGFLDSSGKKITGLRSLPNNEFPYMEGTAYASFLGFVEKSGTIYGVLLCGTSSGTSEIGAIGLGYFSFSEPFSAVFIPEIPSNGANYFIKVKE